MQLYNDVWSLFIGQVSSKERMREKREERKVQGPVRYLEAGQESVNNFAYIISSNSHLEKSSAWLRFPMVCKYGSQDWSSGLLDSTPCRILVWIKSLLQVQLSQEL